MKLFKKLAAVALVGVMALSMVGCGKGGTGASYKTELVNLMKDSMYGTEATVENTAELDSAAQILLANAQTEYGNLDAEAQKDVTEKQITGWLTADAAVAKATALQDKYCFVSFTENPNFVSSLGNQFKYASMMGELMPSSSDGTRPSNQAVVGDPTNENKTQDIKVGFASGKIGSKTYVVMVMY